MKRKLTKHQEYAVGQVERLSGPTGRWVHVRDSGSPSGCAHAYRKGYLARKMESGPRGGVHVYYRPIRFGEEGARATDTFERMPAHEIDRRLIEAREKGIVVLAYYGPGLYYRGVPGAPERDDDGVLRLPIGARKIALKAVARVEVPA